MPPSSLSEKLLSRPTGTVNHGTRGGFCILSFVIRSKIPGRRLEAET